MTRTTRAFGLALAVALADLMIPRASAAEPLFVDDFSEATQGGVPAKFLVLSGQFVVRDEGGARFLESPGAPLDAYGIMFGPARQDNWSVAGRFLGTKQGRRYPVFGASLNGVGGYRVEVAPAKQAVELLKGDLVKASVPFPWKSGEWTQVRVQVRKIADRVWMVEGKAWRDGDEEPKDWMLTWEEKDTPVTGRAAVWGKPFSGTPIRYDDLRVTTIPE